MIRVGIISDTHGLLRPEAKAALVGSDHIIHAGDIGDVCILGALSALAPVTAVRGNNDRAAWADRLPETQQLRIEGVAIHVLHDLAQLAFEPGACGIRVIVAGHSHKPLVLERHGVLYINPGSAGPRRFRLPVAVAQLTVSTDAVAARIVELRLSNPAAR